MDQLLHYVENLSPFLQALLASAVFAVTSWIAQKAFKKAKASGSVLLREYLKLDVVKHILHRDYVHSNDLQKSSYGAAIALLFASRWILLGVLIMLFFFGINSLLNANWLFVAASWFCFNGVLEAYNWVKDSSKEKHIAHVPEDIKREMFTRLTGTPQPPRIEDKGGN